jgi:hypothetical protein
MADSGARGTKREGWPLRTRAGSVAPYSTVYTSQYSALCHAEAAGRGAGEEERRRNEGKGEGTKDITPVVHRMPLHHLTQLAASFRPVLLSPKLLLTYHKQSGRSLSSLPPFPRSSFSHSMVRWWRGILWTTGVRVRTRERGRG